MPATATATHKGSTLIFTEHDHKYVIQNSPSVMVSSTGFIHHYFPEFDADTVSMKVAKKNNPNLNQSELDNFARGLRSNWKANADQACAFGTKIHETCEDFLGNQPYRNMAMTQKELNVMNLGINKCHELLTRYELIDQEMMVFSEKYNLCGTIDLLMRDKVTGVVWILDWKTNKEIKTFNNWQKGLDPIKHLQDCNFNHYSLQLNLYQRILADEGYFPEGTVYNRAIIHLHEELGTREMLIPDMQTEMTALLHHFNHNPWHLAF